MEYCGHCRAVRRTRRSKRDRTVRQADGSVKTMRTESYHCAQCGHFIRGDEYELVPAAKPSPVEEEASTP